MTIRHALEHFILLSGQRYESEILRGAGITGQRAGGPLRGQVAVAGGSTANGRRPYGILLNAIKKFIERFLIAISTGSRIIKR
jgi:hypothetical protein